jgi:putative isomerase
MPTVSYNDPEYSATDYWRGPTWLNTAYYAVKGLKNYGFVELANAYKERILEMCAKEESGIYEYYNSKTGRGLGAYQFGWSAVFIQEFILTF